MTLITTIRNQLNVMVNMLIVVRLGDYILKLLSNVKVLVIMR